MDDVGAMMPWRKQAWAIVVQAFLVVAVLVVCGVLFRDNPSEPRLAEGPAGVGQVALRSEADVGLVSAEQMLGSWTVSNAHGVYHYTFEADGTWTVTRGGRETPIAGGDFSVDAQSRLRFSSGAGYVCGGTATYDMARPDHRTLTGEVIRDDCEFCFFRGARLVLARA